MAQQPPGIIVADTSMLINFLRIDRMDLVRLYSHDVIVTDHVAVEVADHYPDQQDRLAAALANGSISQVDLTNPQELNLFAYFAASGRLGAGECSAIALAIHHGHILAIDDRRAANEARRDHAALQIVTTQDLTVAIIREGLLTIPEADQIKDDWATHHRFRLSISSFADLI